MTMMELCNTDGPIAMKGIVIRAPMWAEIARGEKTVEYRSWPIRHRGPLVICAAKEKIAGPFAGCAVCVVELVDCVRKSPKDFEWILSEPRIIEPVPVAGRLGILDLNIELNFDIEWE